MSTTLLLVSEAANQLRMSPKAVLRYIIAGKLQAYKCERRYLLSNEHITEFLQRREIPLADRMTTIARQQAAASRNNAEIERRAGTWLKEHSRNKC